MEQDEHEKRNIDRSGPDAEILDIHDGQRMRKRTPALPQHSLGAVYSEDRRVWTGRLEISY